MAQKTASLLPATDDLLRQFGERLRTARLRRRLPAKQVAQRAGMSPITLRSLENGGAGVTIGAYLAVMQVLGIENDLDLLGKADPLGRALQDAQLPARAKASRTAPLKLPQSNATPPLPPAAQDTQDWVAQSGFASAQALEGLIDPPAPLPTRRR